MSKRNYVILMGSLSAALTAAVWAAEHKPDSMGAAGGGNIDRAAIIRGLAEHEFAVRKQECDTLKHDTNPNALSDCMRTADQARSDMMGQTSKSDDMASSGQGITNDTSHAMAGQSQTQMPATTSQKQNDNSVVEKVKNTVKDTWSELTGDQQKGNQTSASSGSDGTEKLAAQGQGMVLKGGTGVALFCQPINNLQP